MCSQDQPDTLQEIDFRSYKNSPRAVLMVDDLGVVIYANPAFMLWFALPDTSGVLGHTSEVVLSRVLIDYPTNEKVHSSLDSFKHSSEFHFETSPGTLVPVELVCTPILNERGGLLGELLELEDISERKRLRAKLYETQKRMHLALVAGNMGTWEWDVHRGLISYDIPMSMLYGLPPNEITLDIDEAFKIVHHEDLPGLLKKIDHAICEASEYQYEYRINSSDEHCHWIGVCGHVQLNENQSPKKITGVCYDITKYKTIELELIEKTEYLKSIIHTTIDAIITIDNQGIIRSINEAGERVFQYTAKELIGQNVSMLMPSPHSEQHNEYVSPYIRTGEDEIIGAGRELIAKRSDGSLFPIELLVSEIDHLQLFTVLIRDISNKRAIEDKLAHAERLNSIGTLAAGLGHDMNNILLPVRAHLDSIEGSELPSAVRDQVKEIRKSMRYLEDLAESLHLLLLDPNDADASDEQTDLRTWWDHTHTLLARALPDHTRFTTSISEDLPPAGIAPHRLTQAVLNILINSGRAIRDSDGEVKIWAQLNGESNAIRLGINDNGCGMTNEVKNRVFQPFFTTKTRGIGTGFGLTLVHNIIHSVDGSIDIESQLGQGTEIVLTLPIGSRPLEQPSNDDHNNLIYAGVDLENPKTQSLVLNILELEGIIYHTHSQGGMGGAEQSLWITDTTNLDPECLQKTFAQGCHVILLGQLESDIQGSCLTVLETIDFELIRNAIQRVTETE